MEPVQAAQLPLKADHIVRLKGASSAIFDSLLKIQLGAHGVCHLKLLCYCLGKASKLNELEVAKKLLALVNSQLDKFETTTY